MRTHWFHYFLLRVTTTDAVLSNMNKLEMLTAREQLMEDIDGICDEFFCEHFPNSQEQFDDLVRVLCDAVCKNFPTK